jgi:hypothetical protein
MVSPISPPAPASFTREVHIGNRFLCVWLGYWIIWIASFFFVDTHEIILITPFSLDERNQKKLPS